MIKKCDLLVEFGKNNGKFKKIEKLTKFGATITKFYLDDFEAKNINKEKGDYFCLEKYDADYFLSSEIDNFSKTLCKLIIEIVKKNTKQYPAKYLVVCLGNKNLVCDALAPLVMEKLIITHHIKEYFGNDFADVSAIMPNVMGQTGIESFDIIEGVCKKINPDIIIAIDTFCAENYKRIGKSFQINFGGITPGGGVNNFRKRIDKENLGFNVLTIGVPMVVKAETFLKNNNCKAKSKINDMIITTNEIEMLNKYCSTILARAINMAMHRNIDYKTMLDYMN